MVRFFNAEGAFFKGHAECAEERDGRLAGDAVQDVVRRRAGDEGLAATNPGVVGAAFGDVARVVNHPGVVVTGGDCGHFGERLGEQLGGFDVAPRPADVRLGHDAQAFFGGGAVDDGARLGEHHQVRAQVRVVEEVAVGFAAGNVQVNCAFLQVVRRDEAFLYGDDFRERQRQRHGEFVQAAFEAAQVRGVVRQFAVDDGADFVNAVGHEEAAVEDGDFRFVFGQILAV